MKSIFVIAYDLNPRLGSEAGKACLWVRELSRRYQLLVMVDKRHEADIHSEDFPNVEFEFVDCSFWGSSVLLKLKAYFISHYLFILTSLNFLKNNFDKAHFDCVHFLTPSSFYTYALWLPQLSIPYIVGPLGGGLMTPIEFGVVEYVKAFPRSVIYTVVRNSPFLRKFFEESRCVIVGTEQLKAMLPILRRGKYRVLFDTCVDMEMFSRSVQRWSNFTVILYAARLERSKGILLLLEAFSEIASRHDVTLTILGDGSLRDKVRELVLKLKLGDKVRLCGAVSRDTVIDHMFASDIFCLPSLREPGGVAVLEAMACGLPVVTTDYGGPAVSVDAEVGVKIPICKKDVYIKELALACEELIVNVDKRIAMGKAARERVEACYSRNYIGGEIYDLYDECL
ncbi:glycosyltransferase family 4 protein [Desulfovibrio mangrovi]|uniref:glycosyltransferase family 4 protein n=1 Tax=Desulfovibrio mangrovi TaxID=2976983 RepID=UPI002247FF94|nr:glycosyltransferase family 4 protein [Desulfovibrio mangrovi]UZP67615.1 glycosyltransferase family 4 protein [Desulfovibrio mangrovi]